MTEIVFLINEETVNNLTWEEYEGFEKAQEGTVKLKDLRPIMARFVQNGHGPMEHSEAMKLLGKIPLGKLKETISIFMDTMRNGAIPKENGSPLKSPTDQEQTDSPSLTG